MSRPHLVVVCLLPALLSAISASAQFLPQSITQAPTINAEAATAIGKYVDQRMNDLLAGEPDGVKDARVDLLKYLDDQNASQAFKVKLSELIESQIGPAAGSNSELVRMNAMIILGGMIDSNSVKLVDAGLADKSSAVQRWAVAALQRRYTRVLLPEAKGNVKAQSINDLVAKIDKKLGQDPHPIVVKPALETLMRIGVAGNAKATTAMLKQLNRRVAVHAADPALAYTGEGVVIARMGSLVIENTVKDQQTKTELSQAAYRYASQLAAQAVANRIPDENRNSSYTMLVQCINALNATTATAGKQPPLKPDAVQQMIQQDRWDQIKAGVDSWAAILKAAPFNLNDSQLAAAKQP